MARTSTNAQSTVIHAVEKIGKEMKERRQLYDQVTDLMQTLGTTR